MAKKLYIIIMLFSFSVVSLSQISGNVSDQNGQSLPGVNISVTGTDKNAVSDFDGNFTIEAEIGNDLVFSMIGFQTLKMKAANSMQAVLRDEINSLNEVVVIGYGTKKAGAITGSVAQVKAGDIIRTPAQSAIQAIQGKAAGVNIVTNDEPGATPSIVIRGLGTITAGRIPLYVIDGIESGGLNGLTPNDIATIDILKDASSLAIYGQKGANGVILVTTKAGKKGNAKVSYNGYYGQKFIQRDVEMADSYRFAYYNNSALGSTSYYNFTQPYNTNWLDEITRTGAVASHSVSISGGSDNTSYYFSASNYKEEGILLGAEFERTNVLLKNEYKLLNDRVRITPFVNVSLSKNTPKPLSAFTNAYKQAPIVPVRYPNGRWGAPLINENGLVDYTGTRFNTVANPAAQLFYTNEQNKNVDLIGSISTEFIILKALKFNSNFGATANWGKGYTYTPTRDIFLSQNPSSAIEDYIALFPSNPVINFLEQRRSTAFSWNWDNFLTFEKSFNDHNVKLVAGMSRTTSGISDFLNAKRQDVPIQSNYWSLDLASYSGEVAPGSTVQNKTFTPIVSVAYFGRAEYDYKGKYLLTASIRREGISKFVEAARWENFPAVSAGWVLSQEAFMKDVKFVNSLKLRGGYGEVGNGTASYALNQVVFNAGSGYAFGTEQQIYPGSSIPFAVDENLTWETMKEIDFGLDFAILDAKLSGAIDYYSRKTINVILPIPLPPVLSQQPVYLNSGTITNKGVEVSLKWQDKIGEGVNYWIGGNYAHNQNELAEVSNGYFRNYIGGGLGNGEFTKQPIVGEPLGSFYVYETTGFNSDGGFTYSDERVIAGSYLPTFTYGFNIGMTYKNIDFSVDAYGVGGNVIYNGKKAQRMGGENVENDILNDFWTPSTPNAANPRPFNDRPRASTYYVEDGDYLRINNITLGYTIPKLFEGLDKVRIYLTATNPFLFTKYSGYSPELVGSNNGDPMGTAGIELDAYPTNKTFLLGLNIGF